MSQVSLPVLGQYLPLLPRSLMVCVFCTHAGIEGVGILATISSNSVSRSTAMSASSTTKLATMMGWLFKIEPVTVSAVEETVVLMDIV